MKRDYQKRLNKLIPGGAHTYSRGFDQFPSNAPQILAKGKGAYIWDPEDNKYLDYGMALRAVTIGYSEPRINLAAIQQIQNGNNLTRASMIELEAAELFTNIIPGAEMVKFAKNGSSVTTAAVKIARAFTKKNYICVPRQHPFFSYDDWFISTTPMKRGTSIDSGSFTLLFDYNNIESLKRLFDQFPKQIAGVMLEPTTSVTPCTDSCSKLNYSSPCSACPRKKNNFLHQVQYLCKKNQSLFILDEMITGFRWSLKGAGDYFGVIPDLMTFGKGMANGFSVAAIGGRREIMKVGSIDKSGVERTFLLSTTHGGEMSGLGAFVETVKIYKETDVCKHLWSYGEKFKNKINNLATHHGIEKYFEIIGPPASLDYVTRNMKGEISLEFRTLFAQEMIKCGILIPWISISKAHTDIELNFTLESCDKVFKIFKKALQQGVNKYIEGNIIKPVFRKCN
jgi:glutamate-1-semialdehyde 2,1-aminomutase